MPSRRTWQAPQAVFLDSAVFVHGRLVVQRGLGILRPERGMADLAVVLFTGGMRFMVIVDIAILGRERGFSGPVVCWRKPVSPISKARENIAKKFRMPDKLYKILSP